MSSYYVSVDVEADGPIPGDYSMLALGAVAFTAEGEELGSFEINLVPLPDASEHPDTIAWWAMHPEAWVYCHRNPVLPAEAMDRFAGWLRKFPGKPALVGYPATYDFMWVYWYYVHFIGFPAPFGFAGLDIKTLAMARMDVPFRAVNKRKMPRHWRDAVLTRHDHTPLADARGQMELFLAILEDGRAV